MNDNFRKEKENYEEYIKSLKSKIDNLELLKKDNESLIEENKNLKEKINDLNNKITELYSNEQSINNLNSKDEKERLNNEIAELKNKLKNKEDEIVKINRENGEKINSLIIENEKLNNKLEEITKEREIDSNDKIKLENDLKIKHDLITELTNKNETILNEKEKLIDDLQKAKNDFSEDNLKLESEVSELKSREESLTKSLKQQISDCQLKDDDILKLSNDIKDLKKQLNDEMNINVEYKQRIASFEKEILISNSDKQSIQTHDLIDTVNKYELQIQELQKRLESSQANKEMEMKNIKLSQMLEKSNRLYTTLLEQNQQLLSEQEHFHKKKNNTLSFLKLEEIDIFPIIKEKETKPKKTSKDNDEDSKIINKYLRRVLLQFFLQDDSKKDQLIPLILELAGCTDQQISTAIRQWQRTTTNTKKIFF